jgi:hypothetical protein
MDGTGRQAIQEKAEPCTRLFSKAAAEIGGWVEVMRSSRCYLGTSAGSR